MQTIEHIGIAVKDLATSIPLFEQLLNSQCYKIETVQDEGVKTAFIKTKHTKVELLESVEKDGVIARYIDKRGEGIHHIAFSVDDIESEIRRLSDLGFVILDKAPREGADNKLICFLHPKSTNGVLVELCMERKSPAG